MKNDKSKNILILLLGVIIIILVTLVVLFVTNTISFNSNEITTDNIENNQSTEDSIKNNLTITLSNTLSDECAKGCTKTILNKNGSKSKLYVSSSEVKLDETSILKFDEGAFHLSQVTIYDDIIITVQGFSLGNSMIIYDFNGNKIKTINKFNDNNGRLFAVSPKFSDNKSFNISDEGIISFIGTKHTQGVANTYITDSGNTIDLCTQGDSILDNDIVSGIFKFKYLNNYEFSSIEYVSTEEIVKDIKLCN